MNSVQNPPYQAGMDARFAVAARHSRLVRVLRIAVPAAVILAMTAIVFVSVYNPFRMLLPKLPVDIGRRRHRNRRHSPRRPRRRVRA